MGADGQTDMTKLIIAFLNFCATPLKILNILSVVLTCLYDSHYRFEVVGYVLIDITLSTFSEINSQQRFRE